MKKYIILLTTICLFSCSDKKTSKKIESHDTITIDSISKADVRTIDSKLLIVPGKSIGLTSLGQNTTALSILGKPDLSDAAMGKAWMVWYSKKNDASGFKNELMVSTGYKDSEMKDKVVKEIRINSVDFKTQNEIEVGDSFETIQKEFPDLKQVFKYINLETRKEILIYDSVSSGIAFEIQSDNKICVAIVVHPKQKEVNNEYLVLHPELSSGR